MLALGPLAFTVPWMLLALAVLPALWWLLRVIPPAPKQVRFPAVRLLFGLAAREETPAASPWWLVLLRLLAAALLILALAHPLYNPTGALSGSGPLVLVVDDGWAAAPGWDERMEQLRHAVDRADRERRPVVLVTTAPTADGRPPAASGLMRPAEARTRVAALAPQPWAVDRTAAQEAISGLRLQGSAPVLWLSDGLAGDDDAAFATALQRFGSLTVFAPPGQAVAKALLPGPPGSPKLEATVRRPAAGGNEAVFVRALAADGRLISRQTAAFAAGASAATAAFELPLELRNEVVRIEIEGERSAGAVALLDERWRRRPVGLLTDRPLDSGPSLLSELHFVERALAPFTEISRVALTDLDRLERFAVLLVPDHTPLDDRARAALESWVTSGGLVLRFAGPRLAQAADAGPVPVALRRGGRTLGGPVLWTEPSRLAPFDEGSPFHGLSVPDDVTVTRQVLAEPALDLAAKTWARLTDGTPLVTADKRGEGWLVLVHTTANSEWSNLALSGLFVDMLRKVVQMSRGVAGTAAIDRPLPPIEVLDGFGRATSPPAGTRALAPTGGGEAAVPGPGMPPGLYGREEVRVAVNLGPAVASASPLGDLPSGVAVVEGYERAGEVDLKGALLAAALMLLLVDLVVTLGLRGLLAGPQIGGSQARAVAPGLAAALLGAAALAAVVPAPAHAQTGAGAADSSFADRRALEATLDTRLAYVITGDAAVDAASRDGLIGLSNVLNRRTAAELAEPMAIDLARDDLAFFPLLYWPVTEGQPPPGADGVRRLNQFMATGGTILFDLRDGGTGGGQQQLRALARGLDLPALTAVPADHVLTRAFYLMQEFPGRWNGGRLWVERPGEHVNDGVSRIVVGANDWAAAWAVDAAGNPRFPVVPGGERQREMAYRFGVNLVMYTLTGSYKSDQVHVPSILERLGQ